MKKQVYIILALWVAIITVITISNEYTLRTGKVVLLKTVPVDPRDFFKGDYVILDYAISDMSTYNFDEGETVYTLLNVDKDSGEAYRDSFTTDKPSVYDLYVKGVVDGNRIKYGIEQYYVQEGTGKEIETKLRDTSYAKVAIDKNGNVKIIELIFKDDLND